LPKAFFSLVPTSLLFPVFSFAGTFYVKYVGQGGSDENGGSSWELANATVLGWIERGQ